MEKKALMLASVASMIDQFNIPNIQLLQSLGYKVDVVSNFTNPGTITKERAKNLIIRLEAMCVSVIDIAIPRSLNPRAILSAYRETKKLITTEHYDLIHCHSPIGGGICRLAAKHERKKGTRVIYTAHGFHFYTGAPKKNWILFYPIEKWLSKYTDILITINREDYKRAIEKFHAKKTVYVPGIGVDTKKYGTHYYGNTIRKEFGLTPNDTVLLSVGELNDNKNHKSVIKALAQLEKKPYYIIVGRGDKQEELNSLIKELGLEKEIKLVGFRDDVVDFYDAADAFVFPSFREGLSVSLMEAMASGLPVVCSRIRGNTDLIDEDKGGYFFDPRSVDSVACSIQKLMNADKRELGNNNLQKVKKYDLKNIENLVYETYGGVSFHLLRLIERQKKREELGVPINSRLLISIGELSVRKNHKVVIEAVDKINDGHTYYVIVGKGNCEKELKNRIEEFGLTDHVKLLGYRTDIKGLLDASDIFIFPSLQEGLPVAIMEAMASGLPVVCSEIRGNIDLLDNKEVFFNPYNSNSIAKTIGNITQKNQADYGRYNQQSVRKFDVNVVQKKMSDIYATALKSEKRIRHGQK